MKAVRFDQYGGNEVLHIAEVPTPEPAAGEVLVRVKAAGINPFEWKVRQGMYQAFIPTAFPSGQGSDFAGVVTKVGSAVKDIRTGLEAFGFTNNRASHAEYVVADAHHLTAKPKSVSWEVAGALPVVGTTAYASVRAVALRPGETVLVSAAAGGVGSIAVQLARRAGAHVIGIASPPNHAWLKAQGVIPVAYGNGLADRLHEHRIDALIDAHGDGYVKLAIDLGVARERINTVADFAAVQQYGVKAEGSDAAKNAAVLAELAALVASRELEVPIAAAYPMEQVRAAFEQLERDHTHGKIVLLP
jgi:NADPH:quinone reductase-like Zn-dependent oxidoreductase